MELFDTHAHYDDEAFDADRDELLASLSEKDVSLVLCPGTNMASSEKCLALAGEHDYIYAAVGVHPHDCKGMKDGDRKKLAELAKSPRVRAIGEIGLDYHYDYSPRDVQRQRFREQMGLAWELGLPVIVHDREAHGDSLDIVKEFKGLRGVFHCYSGALEDARTLIRLGWYLSFTGAITFNNARKALEVIEWMPEDRLMLETDSPYLTPVPHRGERNDSSMVRLVAEAIARVRHITAERAAEITMKNGKTFFGIK